MSLLARILRRPPRSGLAGLLAVERVRCVRLSAALLHQQREIALLRARGGRVRIVYLVQRDDGHGAEAVFASADEVERDRVLDRLRATAHHSSIIYEADLVEIDDHTLADGLVREAVGGS